jgi:PilZ domain-containing protein
VSSGSTASLSVETLSGEINLRRDCGDVFEGPAERRVKPRIRRPFPATVTGVDADGREFAIETQLANMSSSGLYLRIPRRLGIGDRLNFIIRFSNEFGTGATAAVLGRVVRVEPGLDGLNGFGLGIMEYKFI